MIKRKEAQSGANAFGQILAVLCFLHCSLFISALLLIEIGIVIFPPILLLWFDNIFIHSVFATIAISLVAIDLLFTHKEITRAIFCLAIFGGILLTSSLLLEVSQIVKYQNTNNTTDNLNYTHNWGCAHSPYTVIYHSMFITGNLLLLGAHHSIYKKRHCISCLN